MDLDIQAIIDQAELNTNAEQAAVEALGSLFQALTDAIANSTSLSVEDREVLKAKVAAMEASRVALSAAIVANTLSGEVVVEPPAV